MDATTSTAEELLSAEDTAKRLTISRRQLDRLRLQGTGPAYLQISDHVRRYRVADVDAFLEAARRTSSSAS